MEVTIVNTLGKASVMFAALAVWLVPVAGALDGPWKIEAIDRTGIGKYSTLKIDKEGNAHLAYVVDEGTHPLKYAFWDHSSKHWFTMEIAQEANFCDLALDSKQHPHVSWADFGTTSGAKLRHAYWDGEKWKQEAIPLNSDVIGYYTSIVLDANDNPTISFYEYRGPKGSDIIVRMRTVTSNGKYWEVRTVDGDNQSGKFNALAIDSQSHIHLVYANVNALTASTRYAFWNGKTWKLEVVDDRERNNTELVGYSVCIALDKSGDPHIAYMNYSRPALRYAVRKAGQWFVQEVESLAGVGYPDRNSIVIDDEGLPYLGYYDAGLGILKVAHYDGQRWTIEIVDRASSGFTSSLQISGGMLWITYGDEASGAMKVARREIGASSHVKLSLDPQVPPQHRE